MIDVFGLIYEIHIFSKDSILGFAFSDENVRITTSNLCEEETSGKCTRATGDTQASIKTNKLLNKQESLLMCYRLHHLNKQLYFFYENTNLTVKLFVLLH